MNIVIEKDDLAVEKMKKQKSKNSVYSIDKHLSIKKNKISKKSKIKNFFDRVSSGIILIILLAVSLYFGGSILFIVTMIVSILGLMELYSVINISKTSLGIIGYILSLFYYFSLYKANANIILMFLIVSLLTLLIFYVISFPKYKIDKIAKTLFGIIYVVIMTSFIYLIREQSIHGKYFVWLIFIASWGSDTFAYITGLLFGKHKLSKKLSPKKTIEGFIGGIMGAIFLGILYTYIMFNKISPEIDYRALRVGLACGFGSVISTFGDLTASAIKREYDIKDYGDIIPGHGGILDRFDSVIFTAPVLFFVLNI